jgi:hypothetical protein
MGTFEVCVLLFTGLVTGLSVGIAIRNKQVNRLKDQIDAADGSYARLLDLYMEKFYELSIEKARKEMQTPKVEKVVQKKSPGRPKGSTNKPKENGRSTTRKYTRKSSK